MKEMSPETKEFVAFLLNKYGNDLTEAKLAELKKSGQLDKDILEFKLKKEKAKAKKAAHGAKLNYIRSLSHKCADDEELYYFKKGGSIVDCGCRKKDGGKVEKEEDTSWKSKFKNRVKKDCGGSKVKLKDGDKVKSAGAGCIAKFKMHRLGGTLNNISFFQNGGKKKSINDYYLTDYSEPNILQKVKLNGKELTIKVNKGQLNGEDPITILGNNYYLTGDSTLRKDNSIPYSFLQLRNAGTNKK